MSRISAITAPMKLSLFLNAKLQTFFPAAANLQDFNRSICWGSNIKKTYLFWFKCSLLDHSERQKNKESCNFRQRFQIARGHARPTLCMSYLNVTTSSACNEKCLWLTVSSFHWLFSIMPQGRTFQDMSKFWSSFPFCLAGGPLTRIAFSSTRGYVLRTVSISWKDILCGVLSVKLVLFLIEMRC